MRETEGGLRPVVDNCERTDDNDEVLPHFSIIWPEYDKGKGMNHLISMCFKKFKLINGNNTHFLDQMYHFIIKR